MATVDKKAAFAWMVKLERGFASSHFAEKFGIQPRRAKRILWEFRHLGAVQNFGQPPKSWWEVIDPTVDVCPYGDRKHPKQLAALEEANKKRAQAKRQAVEVLAWWPPKTELEKCWGGVSAAIDTECEEATIDLQSGELCPQE